MGMLRFSFDTYESKVQKVGLAFFENSLTSAFIGFCRFNGVSKHDFQNLNFQVYQVHVSAFSKFMICQP
jgi:hypothetical protein